MNKINVVLVIRRRIIRRAENKSDRRHGEIGFSLMFENVDLVRREVKVKALHFTLVYGRVLLDVRRVHFGTIHV